MARGPAPATTPVHPRGCGERRSEYRAVLRRGGSSPRVRGTPAAPEYPATQPRFIPAGAGNAAAGHRAPAPAPVHPRGCGERGSRPPWHWPPAGSSPRVRGTPQPAARLCAASRFIPAGAGNAPVRLPRRTGRAVHPRGCGEREISRFLGRPVHGSSPRVRGTRIADLGRARAGRFIPAGAGNACPFSSINVVLPVHPRGCGERDWVAVESPTDHGSSPRVRGTLRGWSTRRGILRFIPAGAGNALSRSSNGANPPVHPRGCGERASRETPPGGFDGSSPRVRGTRRRRCCPAAARRFIPAGAGNAARVISCPYLYPVHPRGCGERFLA